MGGANRGSQSGCGCSAAGTGRRTASAHARCRKLSRPQREGMRGGYLVLAQHHFGSGVDPLVQVPAAEPNEPNRRTHSTAQHSTAQHSTAQHSTAQHSTARIYKPRALSAPPGPWQHGAARRECSRRTSEKKAQGCLDIKAATGGNRGTRQYFLTNPGSRQMVHVHIRSSQNSAVGAR